jgi:hypothetical protein
MYLFKKQTWLTTAILLTLTACGGGGGGGSGSDTPDDPNTPDNPNTPNNPDTSDTTAPTVSSTTPAESSTAVPRNSNITANFDEDIFATTVDATSFTLAQSGSISGEVTFDGSNNVATLTPTGDLSILTTYTATLSTEITDLNGNPLAADYSWSFTTVEGAWGTAEMIDDDTKDASTPQIAFDNSGNAIAVWSQNNGITNSIWANHFDGSTAEWSAAELIEGEAGDATSPQLAVDSSGNAIAVWSQSNGITNSIWANRFDGIVWSAAESIEANAGNAASPQVAFDSSGNAIAVWSQSEGLLPSTDNIMANRFDSTTAAWETAELIESINTGDAAFPQVAFDSSGNAIAVWQQNDGSVDNIMANRFDGTVESDGFGWGDAELIETGAGNASSPQVAFDNSGNAIAVWSQNNVDETNPVDNIMASRFDVTVEWGDAESIGNDTLNETSPQVAIDNSGNAIAVWSQNDDDETDPVDNIMANRFDSSDVLWGDAESIETGAGNAASPQVAFDSSGNAIAVWSQNNVAESPVDNIMVSRFNGTTVEWLAAESIVAVDAGNAGNAASPQVALDSSGNAIAVWSQNDGADSDDVDNIVVNSFR